jgi:hypothetical protein
VMLESATESSQAYSGKGSRTEDSWRCEASWPPQPEQRVEVGRAAGIGTG